MFRSLIRKITDLIKHILRNTRIKQKFKGERNIDNVGGSLGISFRTMHTRLVWIMGLKLVKSLVT